MDFPMPGEVIRYAYLWHSEQQLGREEAAKDRPCVVILANADTSQVWVAPITHAPPLAEDIAIVLPLKTKLRLGLDSDDSWIVLSDLNQFAWAGPDIRIAPGRSPTTCSYGHLPAALYENIRRKLLDAIQHRAVLTSKRTE